MDKLVIDFPNILKEQFNKNKNEPWVLSVLGVKWYFQFGKRFKILALMENLGSYNRITFALKSGVIFTNRDWIYCFDEKEQIAVSVYQPSVWIEDYQIKKFRSGQFFELVGTSKIAISQFLSYGWSKECELILTEPEIKFLLESQNIINQKVDNFQNKLDLQKEKLKLEKEENEKILFLSKEKSLLEFDKDGNGQLDVIEIKDTLDQLLRKHQSKIIEIDRSYIQHFVKMSNYQKKKRENLQSIFKYLSKTKSEGELNQYVKYLKEQINTYKLLVFHSLNMVTCLVSDDMITFYEIYESFDKLGMFNSNWENEVSEQLSDLNKGIMDLMGSIRSMERNMVRELMNLSYVTQESFNTLSNSVTSQLNSIDETLKFYPLLTNEVKFHFYKGFGISPNLP